MHRLVATVVASFVIAPVGCIVLGPSSSSTGGSTSTGTTTTTTTTTTATTATGGPGCDGQPTCDACLQCATVGACAQAIANCDADSSCVGLDQCIMICGTTSDCVSQCEAQNQTGVTDFDAKQTCLYCMTCPTACSGFATCGGG